ncbi:MAG: hypothetical protein U0324_46875 [Polyangiales bacterium]
MREVRRQGLLLSIVPLVGLVLSAALLVSIARTTRAELARRDRDAARTEHALDQAQRELADVTARNAALAEGHRRLVAKVASIRCAVEAPSSRCAADVREAVRIALDGEAGPFPACPDPVVPPSGVAPPPVPAAGQSRFHVERVMLRTQAATHDGGRTGEPGPPDAAAQPMEPLEGNFPGLRFGRNLARPPAEPQ